MMSWRLCPILNLSPASNNAAPGPIAAGDNGIPSQKIDIIIPDR